MRRSGPRPRHRPPLPQDSAFAEECEQLYAAEQHEKLLDKFISALDVVLSSSSSDAGERRRLAAARPALLPQPSPALPAAKLERAQLLNNTSCMWP